MLQRTFILATLAAICIACSPNVSRESTLDSSADATDLTRLNIHGQKMFLNGVNLAWNKYGRDFGDFSPETDGYDRNDFDSAFNAISQAGGNAVRIWVHTSGEFNPKHDANGFYICNDAKFFTDMSDMLDLAQDHNLVILLSLWSFDMLDSGKNPNIFGDYILPRNKALLTDPKYLDAYINNCYVKILDNVKDKPAMFAIEVLNEPEGMTPLENWSNTAKVPMSAIQRFIGKIAAVTHEKAPAISVTSGALGADFLSNYTDQALSAASGEAGGTLDFFEIHYYDTGSNPLATAARVFSPKKPLIIGEFASNYPDLTAVFKGIFDHGYAGGFAWKFKTTSDDPHGSWADGKIAPALSVLSALHPAAIKPQRSSNPSTQSQGASAAKSSGSWSGDTGNSAQGGKVFPLCTRSDSDPDHDGWGWENNESCRVPPPAGGA